jgi:hypothetical protein
VGVDRDPWQQLRAGVRPPFHPERAVPRLFDVELPVGARITGGR